MLATYTVRRPELSAEQAVSHTNLAYETIIFIFKELEDISVGRFVLGRRNHKTRIVWNYSPMSIGEVAQGRDTTLEAINDDYQDVAAEEPAGASNELSMDDYHRVIREAKVELARQLRLKPEQVEITIRH